MYWYSSLKNILWEILEYEGLVALMEMVPRNVGKWSGMALWLIGTMYWCNICILGSLLFFTCHVVLQKSSHKTPECARVLDLVTNMLGIFRFLALMSAFLWMLAMILWNIPLYPHNNIYHKLIGPPFVGSVHVNFGLLQILNMHTPP